MKSSAIGSALPTQLELNSRSSGLLRTDRISSQLGSQSVISRKMRQTCGKSTLQPTATTEMFSAKIRIYGTCFVFLAMMFNIMVGRSHLK
ncbi:chromo domain-containing protein [Colletotrichum asianum]